MKKLKDIPPNMGGLEFPDLEAPLEETEIICLIQDSTDNSPR